MYSQNSGDIDWKKGNISNYFSKLTFFPLDSKLIPQREAYQGLDQTTTVEWPFNHQLIVFALLPEAFNEACYS